MAASEYQRHYYSKSHSFEQSLDVYKPANTHQTSRPTRTPPLVVLVVGSGWLGHRPIIYTGTSWWNASGPRALAKLGCVCVCIRHRGAFPKIYVSAKMVVSCLVILTAFALAIGRNAERITATLTLVFGVFWALLELGGRGSASFDDMQQDVADALCWVHKTRAKLETLNTHSENNHESSTEISPLVFGGYSSGGHVAATVLQRPDLLRSKGLPPPEKICDVVLMLSAVLAVRPPNKNSKVDEVGSQTRSRWLTDAVLLSAFGPLQASVIPSPLEHTLQTPRLPHVLVGCTKEMFGLPWLDTFFCSQEFVRNLQSQGTPARWVEVNANHWTILNSRQLKNALKEELQMIGEGIARYSKGDNDKIVCSICQRMACVGGHDTVRALEPTRGDLRPE